MRTHRRLKKIWRGKQTKLAAKLGKLMERNFKLLRELQATVTPCMPYLGMTLTDLTYINDGNPDYYQGAKGGADAKTGENTAPLYNWDKIALIGQAFQRLARLQHTSFGFEPNNEIIALIHAMRPTITEDEMYQLSLKIQPRQGSA